MCCFAAERKVGRAHLEEHGDAVSKAVDGDARLRAKMERKGKAPRLGAAQGRAAGMRERALPCPALPTTGR